MGVTDEFSVVLSVSIAHVSVGRVSGRSRRPREES